MKKTLGLLDATSLVAGSMIGSGIFIVSSQMARDVGSSGWLIVLWLITGLITILAALSYGELAGMMPNAGGQYVYISRAYGRLTSFLYGWSVFTVIQTGVIAAVAVAFSKYAAVFFPGLNKALFSHAFGVVNYGHILSIASLVFLTFINSRGVQNGRLVQLIFTSTKIFALFAIIILGLVIGLQTDTLSHNFTDMWSAYKTTVGENNEVSQIPLEGFVLMGALGATIINSLFSSDAWNNVTFIAGEIKDPKRNLPRSLIYGTLIVTGIYILVNLAYLALLPISGDINASGTFEKGIMFAENNRVGASAASVIFGNAGAYIMAALIMISTFGCNNGLILSGSRLFYAMSKDKLFFQTAKEINKYDVPGKALWIQCFWACILCLSGTYEDLLVYATFVSLIFYILTIGGIFILRKKEPLTERPYKVFGYPILPALYILITGAICIDLLIYDTTNTGLGLLLVGLGLPIYFIIKKNEK